MVLEIGGIGGERETDLPKIADAGDAPPPFPSGAQRGKQQSRQYADHGDHCQEFDQCETGRMLGLSRSH
jgi:hypothetical protein